MDGILLFLQLFIAGGIFLFWKYWEEKGKNLATKEDIGEITKKIEMIKGAIGSQLYIHQFRYQNEFKILLDLSEKVVMLKTATLAFRPMLDSFGGGEEEKKKRMDEYWEIYRKFYRVVECRKPFYHQDIYNEVIALEKTGRLELVQYKFTFDRGEERDPKYWENAIKNAEKIEEQAEKVLEAIRARITKWENFSPEKGF